MSDTICDYSDLPVVTCAHCVRDDRPPKRGATDKGLTAPRLQDVTLRTASYCNECSKSLAGGYTAKIWPGKSGHYCQSCARKGKV